MAGFSTGLLGFQQSADDYYKNLANDAMMQGQQAETDRQNAQQYAQLAASLPLYDPTTLDYARQLVASKVGYEQAADAAEQARHHENAEIVRREAAKNGIDLSRFDATNVNANQANTNLSMMLNEARRDFMNRETPDELYTRRKNELMRDGLNEERAMEQAAREYQEYSARYRHAGRNLFYDQGTTENAINNLGAYVLTGLGDPQAAQMFASLYAHPVDDYKQDWARNQAYMAADIANNKAILVNRLNMDRDNNNFNNRRILNDEQFAQALQKFVVQNQYARENAEAQRQAQFQNIVDWIGFIKKYNPELTDQEAFSLYMGMGSQSKGKGTNQQEKLSKAQQALKNIGSDAMRIVHSSKDRSEVDAAIAELRDKKQELSKSGELTQEDIASTDELIKQLEAMKSAKWPN